MNDEHSEVEGRIRWLNRAATRNTSLRLVSGHLIETANILKHLQSRIDELEAQINNIKTAYETIDLNAACTAPALLFDLTDSIYQKPEDYYPRGCEYTKILEAQIKEYDKALEYFENYGQPEVEEFAYNTLTRIAAMTGESDE